jgi:hypothetical protein
VRGAVLETRSLRYPLSRSRVTLPKGIERYLDTSGGIYGDVGVQESPCGVCTVHWEDDT